MLELLQGLREGAAQHPDLRRHRRRQNDAAQRALQLHLRKTSASSPSKTPPNCAAPDARGAHGNAPGQHRRQRRHQHPRSGDQRPSYAPRPHHRRRGPQRRSAGHAAGHEHRPRRLAHHHPRQHAARRRRPPRSHGRHGQRQHGRALHPPAGRAPPSTCWCRSRASATAPAA